MFSECHRNIFFWLFLVFVEIAICFALLSFINLALSEVWRMHTINNMPARVTVLSNKIAKKLALLSLFFLLLRSRLAGHGYSHIKTLLIYFWWISWHANFTNGHILPKLRKFTQNSFFVILHNFLSLLILEIWYNDYLCFPYGFFCWFGKIKNINDFSHSPKLVLPKKAYNP